MEADFCAIKTTRRDSRVGRRDASSIRAVRRPRRGLAAIAVALPNAGAGFLVAAHRQLQAVDAARAPLDPADADRRVEQGKMLVSHGSLPCVNKSTSWREI